jgi:hypothetical protein
VRYTTLQECFLSDLKRLDPDINLRSSLKKCIFNAGVLAVVLFRITQYLYKKKFIWRLSPFISRINQILTGFECHINADIGQGLFIPHSQDIVIGAGVIIGENVTIYNGVTLGAKIMKQFDPDLTRKNLAILLLKIMLSFIQVQNNRPHKDRNKSNNRGKCSGVEGCSRREISSRNPGESA